MTRLPRIAITRADGGWLATCSCKAEAWQQRRPQADRWAHEHARSHARKD